SILRKHAASAAKAAAAEPVPMPDVEAAPEDTLVLDPHTLKDLEVFNTESCGKSLFEFYDQTVTQGGSFALRQRMAFPFADAHRIRQTQQSVSFIRANRGVFSKIPFYIVGRVVKYQKDPLMFVTHKNQFDFTLGALSLKFGDPHHYHRIVRGVQYSCLLIRALREFLDQHELTNGEGEIATVCEEMQQLLSKTGLCKVPEFEVGDASLLKMLRLDQIFRIHEKNSIERLVALIFQIDSLLSMTDATVKNCYVIPEILDGDTRMQARGLVHPQVECAVSNDLRLDQNQSLLFLTGPNMAGKTTYLRAAATALYLGHLGMGVPAESFSFVPVQRLFSSITVTDDVHTGTSYYLAEVQRIKSIASAVAEGFRVVAIMDEPFKGTNVKDAFEASLAVMKRLESKSDCLFLFSSHLIELGEHFETSTRIKKCYFEARETEGRLQFDYVLNPGVSSQRLGMRVLSEEGVFELLDSAT
ncbi:MAG: hypothetical protein KJN90_14115, partial [Gammaproteobacteria bacterium]|nr:hypothetical protein [Gammaproteobacteria bacterium]